MNKLLTDKQKKKKLQTDYVSQDSATLQMVVETTATACLIYVIQRRRSNVSVVSSEYAKCRRTRSQDKWFNAVPLRVSMVIFLLVYYYDDTENTICRGRNFDGNLLCEQLR